MNNLLGDASASVASVRRNDVVVITTDRLLSREQAASIKQNVELAFATAQVLVLGAGLQITVVRDGVVQPVVTLRKRPLNKRFMNHYREYRKFMSWPKAVYAAWVIARL